MSSDQNTWPVPEVVREHHAFSYEESVAPSAKSAQRNERDARRYANQCDATTTGSVQRVHHLYGVTSQPGRGSGSGILLVLWMRCMPTSASWVVESVGVTAPFSRKGATGRLFRCPRALHCGSHGPQALTAMTTGSKS
jgi:hypothetical protein